MGKIFIKFFAAPALLIAPVLTLLILNGCGGGGGSIPYIPQNAARECVSGPTASRIAQQTTSYDSVWCVQIHEYGQTIPVLSGNTVTVTAGSTKSLQAIVYDAACSNLTSSFASSISWSSTGSIGTLSSSGADASLSAPSVTSSVSGTITATLYNASTIVKQDTINVTVQPAPAVVPSAPASLAATAGDSQASLTWTAPTTNTDSSSLTNLAGYNVYYSTTSGGSYTQHNSTTVTGSPYTATGLTNGTTYYFVVQAYNSASPVGSSANSNEASVTPVAPTLSVSAAASPTSATLSAGTASSTLTCTVSGGTPTTLEGRCNTSDAWATIASGNTKTCTYTAAGTYTPGCQVNGTTSADVTTAVTISAAAATTFKTFYGDASTAFENGTAVAQTSDGGYIIAGTNGGNSAIYKTDSNGNQAWTMGYTGGSAGQIIQTTDGGYAFVGSSGGQGLLVKIDSGGTQTWAQTYAAMSEGHGVIETGTGFIVVGKAANDGALVVTNTTGVQQSSQTYDNAGQTSEYIKSINSTSDGGYVLGGYSGDMTTNDDIWLIKTTSTGVESWQKTFNSGAFDHAVAAYQTTTGYALGGYISDTSYSSADCFILLTDTSGNQTSLVTYGEPATTDFCYHFNTTSDGGFVLTGPSQSTGTNGLEDYWLVKTNSSATQEWAKFFGTANNEWSNWVVQTSDGGYAVMGSAPNGASNDYWFVKTDSSGLSP